MKKFHDAAWLKINDPKIVHQFLIRFGIVENPGCMLNQIASAFKKIPYENLTKIIKSHDVISFKSAMRFPDELLRDFLTWGTGGTCFSLTAAIIALLNFFKIEAHPILADRHYGINTHCGVFIPTLDSKFYILDPGFLVYDPVEINLDHSITIENNYNKIELCPSKERDKISLHTILNKQKKYRLTFKIQPISAEEFYRAWENSFAFEMMNYPVLTREVNGTHEYLQGNLLSIRTANSVNRVELTPEKQVEYISKYMGIHTDIVTNALRIVHHG